MPDTDTKALIANRLDSMTEDEAIANIKLVQTLPQGKQATKVFVKQLTPKEKRKMKFLANGFISFLDGFNHGLETIVNLVYLLP